MSGIERTHSSSLRRRSAVLAASTRHRSFARCVDVNRPDRPPSATDSRFHARIDGIERPITLFIRTRRPIAFDAPDGKPVSQMLAITVPEDGAKDDHLQLLALMARLFSEHRFRAQLDGAPDAAAVEDAFRAGTARVASASS